MFAPESVVVPVLALTSTPLPPIAFVTVIALLRLSVSVASFVTAPDPSVPVVPAAPICRVPALIVVVPEYVLVPVSVVVPAPACTRLPLPLITLATVNALLRLNLSVALSVTAPVPSVPAAPPAPTSRVPALTVVVPV